MSILLTQTKKTTWMLFCVICGVVFSMCLNAAQAALLSNLTISDAVEDELQQDPAVPGDLIDVTTMDGIVTLRGRVDNLLAKERAVRIAETVKGVRAVVNTIEVMPSVIRSDLDIRRDVEDALLMNPATEAFEVAVGVKNNVVTLSGEVDSWQEKQLCEMVAKGVGGVKDVVNSISFTHKKNRADSEIKQEIEQTLRWDVLVDHALIKVDVKNGHVELSGIVGSLAEKSRAAADAYVAGVGSVDVQNLEVKLWARDPNLKGDKYQNITDDKIKKAVKDALFYDPRVLSVNVIPEVKQGVVSLRGAVSNLQAKYSAAQTTRNTVGVIEVNNRLKVRPQKNYSNQLLKNHIEHSLKRAPYIDPGNITVIVRNGVTDLFGSVDTYFEKTLAEDIASRITGVIAVNNYLAVNKANYPYLFDPYVDSLYWYKKGLGYPLNPRLVFKTDTEIKDDIEDEFFWSPFVDGDDIHIEMDNGTATLTGTVDTWGEYNAAAENAYEGGALLVNNKLEVSSK
jgi:osmotically-inducible protein OsmY